MNSTFRHEYPQLGIVVHTYKFIILMTRHELPGKTIREQHTWRWGGGSKRETRPFLEKKMRRTFLSQFPMKPFVV